MKYKRKEKVMTQRTSGVLMHITSLPGEYGIGSFGQSAYDFVDFLVETKQTYWQILPLTTTSYGDSPYQSFSAIAGNTHLIDFALLKDQGLLESLDLEKIDFGDRKDRVDYVLIDRVRRPILAKAVNRFLNNSENRERLLAFETEHSSWLADYAEFMAIKETFGNRALQEWEDQAILARDEAALSNYRSLLANQITYFKVCQYFFFTQWKALKTYANQRHIKIIGDMPIYVSADSVEVWTKPELFKLDESRKPTYVAGVPADQFSTDGQLWGNPLYDWEAHERTGFNWWIYRIRESFKLYDVLRIDHFKGFSDFWQVDGRAKVAKEGTWEPGPGYSLFKTIKETLGDLPIIAEDLGNIDSKARQLLSDCGYPGMKILEFGLSDITGKSIDAPHRCVPHSVAYIGTHDNEVVNDWYQKLSPEQKEYVDAYSNRKPIEPVNQAILRVLFGTVSNIAIASMQDILDLDADSRMNFPSTIGGNWQWRMKKEDLTQTHKEFLARITLLYQRENVSNS
ncbi:4-alpha-glucanotransferase [Streptococcus ovuberis]|uniref:4-alpha-glucanotransferase n=1 Tax=Streptococcus ovuberis TaxID=1936207 RepID=A0A7X6MXH0_9STRE|nr:4-alpha-glucanotransferase [Streptococcus ovuberis]NKZ20187.1 4-alpha-glucanotransferase [Streptococcus ovuberis]